jgi:tRNA(Ile2)-agmatinylcytidine synthase
MTVVGLDDTDSREYGMCTTYAASEVASRLRAAGHAVDDLVLVRLLPAIEFKTRGNAALAVHTDAPAADAFAVARDVVAASAALADPDTNPGLVVAPGAPDAVPDAVARFSRAAMRERRSRDRAHALADRHRYRTETWDEGRGVVGALAAVGAHAALDEWTYETIAYRERERWGTPRDVDHDSVFAAADTGYPTVWDTVDRETGDAVCIPHAPGPILYGIRGDDPDACRAVAADVASEPVARTATFRTNQGRDVHLHDAPSLADCADGRAYRVDATVVDPPTTGEGGHVFLTVGDADATRRAAAFAPTRHFRDNVRALRPGDRLTLCGEASDGTLKLEKFAVRDLDRTALTTPDCPDCGRSMESAGRDQGYRCRDCGTTAPGKVETEVERDLEVGWYEVPPCARRHVARPLVRGGFDAPTHPER